MEERAGLNPDNRKLCRKAAAWSSEVPMTLGRTPLASFALRHSALTQEMPPPGQLKSKRDEFWDTQPNYSGRREIWQVGFRPPPKEKALLLACQ
eukprot:2011223-Rhodomonas_salina.1